LKKIFGKCQIKTSSQSGDTHFSGHHRWAETSHYRGIHKNIKNKTQLPLLLHWPFSCCQALIVVVSLKLATAYEIKKNYQERDISTSKKRLT
jgi:hypothetical protein